MRTLKVIISVGMVVGLLVGFIAIAAQGRRAKEPDPDFARTRLMPPQEPFTDFAVQSAREAAKQISPSELVLGVVIGSQARAYPLGMIAGPSELSQLSHELLNDRLGDEPILTTWCELCHHGMVYSREVDGRELTFAAEGSLWKGNLVFYDVQTRSLWSQLAGEAKAGPLKGKKLLPIPTIRTDWESWYAQHPDGTVAMLSWNNRHYQREVYASVPPDSLVLAIAEGGHAWAWTFRRLQAEPALNDQIDGKPVVAVFDGKSYTARLFKRTVEGKELTFAWKAGKLKDDQTGSCWGLLTGRAEEGALAGKSLSSLRAVIAYQSSWLNFHPDSLVAR
jgi:hypothetical protein